MKKYYLLLVFVVFACFSNKIFSQISYGGTPPSFTTKSISDKFDIREFPKLDMVKVQAQDSANEMKGISYKVGRSIPINLNIGNSGTWTALPDGRNIWRLTIKSADAKAIAVYYDKFYLPLGSQLFLYNKNKNQVIGAFTNLNNPLSGYFATELIQGDEVTLEYVSSLKSIKEPVINISEISYVYRGVDHLFAKLGKSAAWGTSGICEVNVNCPEGNNWQNQKRGVAEIFITSPAGQSMCSGSLMNNTNNDCTAYFLSAFHCWESATTAQMHQWEFYFNYEASGCTTPGTQPTYNTLTGCTLEADGDINGGSDFLLLLFDVPVPASINPYFNGWDANNTASPSGVGIHHPEGDIKKISTYTSALTSTTFSSTSPPATGASNAHWQVTWAATTSGHGVTEQGSSGSPIFNNNGLSVGTLSGGGSLCSALTSPDDYGKMSYHWTSNGTANNVQLKPWLDPTNTGALTCVGKNNCTVVLTAAFIGAPQTVFVGGNVTFTDQSLGSPATYAWTFSGGTPSFSNIANPIIAYNTVGVYDVKLKVSNGGGSDSLTKVGYITVTNTLAADFTGTPTTINMGSTVTFTDNSVGNPTSWHWIFNGGSPGTWSGVNPPAILYNAAGSYTVTLTDSAGTSTSIKTKTSYITVINPNAVVTDFIGNPTILLKGQTVTFNDLSTGSPTTWAWTFNSGTPNTCNHQNPPPILYSHTGFFDVKLIASKVQGVTYYTNTKTKVQYISVYDSTSLPKANFNADFTTVMQGNSVNFYDLSANMGAGYFPVTWRWIFDNGVPNTSPLQNPTNIVYNNLGVFPVTLVITNFLGKDSIVKTTYIHVIDASSFGNVKVDFTASKRLLSRNETTDFSDLSEGNPDMWIWTFDGASVPTGENYVQNPQNILYGGTGEFKVTLVASNSITMDSLTKTKYIIVFDSPYPNPDGYCDTSTNVLPTEQTKTYRHLTTVPTWGYFPGHNSYNTKVYAEKFTNYTISNIHQLIVYPSKSFASFSGSYPYNRVKWHVWSVGPNGMPFACNNCGDLGYVYTNISDLHAGVANTITFPTPIPVNGNFFVGFEISYYPSVGGVITQLDTFALYMAPNRGANKLNTVYINKFPNDTFLPHWLTPTQLLNDTLNTSLDIGIVGCLLGIDDNDFDKNIVIYPNPSNNLVNIDFGDIVVNNVDIKVYDILGKLVNDNIKKTGSNHFTMNLGSYSPGIYFVKINLNNKIINRKISIIR